MDVVKYSIVWFGFLQKLLCLILHRCVILFAGLQLLYTPIGYPGVRLGPLTLNLYTAAPYSMVLYNLFSLVLLCCWFKESDAGLARVEKDHNESTNTIRRSRLLATLPNSALQYHTHTDVE